MYFNDLLSQRYKNVKLFCTVNIQHFFFFSVIKDLFSELQKLPDLDENQITALAKLYGLK